MKKCNIYIKSAVIILLAAFTTGAAAQPNFTLGPKAGVNFSWLSNVDDPGVKTGFTAGAFAIYSAWEHFGISADLAYAGKGSRYDVPSPEGGVWDRNLTLHYIELPVLANYFFLDRGSVVRPKISLGPAFSYLVAGSEDGSGTTSSQNNFDIGVTGGIGANFALSEMIWLNIDARYTHGFMDVISSGPGSSGDAMNRAIGVAVGVGFGIGTGSKAMK